MVWAPRPSSPCHAGGPAALTIGRLPARSGRPAASPLPCRAQAQWPCCGCPSSAKAPVARVSLPPLPAPAPSSALPLPPLRPPSWLQHILSYMASDSILLASTGTCADCPSWGRSTLQLQSTPCGAGRETDPRTVFTWQTRKLASSQAPARAPSAWAVGTGPTPLSPRLPRVP